MQYPNLKEVENADLRTLCKWWRFLPPLGQSGADAATSEEFQRVLKEHAAIIVRIGERIKGLGGMTPEISESIVGERIDV